MRVCGELIACSRISAGARLGVDHLDVAAVHHHLLDLALRRGRARRAAGRGRPSRPCPRSGAGRSCRRSPAAPRGSCVFGSTSTPKTPQHQPHEGADRVRPPARSAITSTRISRDTRGREGLGVGDRIGLGQHLGEDQHQRRHHQRRERHAAGAEQHGEEAGRQRGREDVGEVVAERAARRSAAPCPRSAAAPRRRRRRRARPWPCSLPRLAVVSAVSEPENSAETSSSTRIPAPVPQRARRCGASVRRCIDGPRSVADRPSLCGQGASASSGAAVSASGCFSSTSSRSRASSTWV